MFKPAYRISNMIKGMIMLWFGSVATIPSGWHLCNGDMGTPNLTGKFLVGAGDTYYVDAVGGVIEHTHQGSFSDHVHGLNSYPNIVAGSDVYTSPYAVTDTKSGFITPTTEGNVPFFHALCFMMKL